MNTVLDDPTTRNASEQRCAQCGGDHPQRAHVDSLVALHHADQLRALGDVIGAEHWERHGKALAVKVVSR